LQVARTQRAAYKSQRPEGHRGVGMALLHLTEKKERKNGLGGMQDESTILFIGRPGLGFNPRLGVSALYAFFLADAHPKYATARNNRRPRANNFGHIRFLGPFTVRGGKGIGPRKVLIRLRTRAIL
jgi:hypothetical protein